MSKACLGILELLFIKNGQTHMCMADLIRKRRKNWPISEGAFDIVSPSKHEGEFHIDSSSTTYGTIVPAASWKSLV